VVGDISSTAGGVVEVAESVDATAGAAVLLGADENADSANKATALESGASIVSGVGRSSFMTTLASSRRGRSIALIPTAVAGTTARAAMKTEGLKQRTRNERLILTGGSSANAARFFMSELLHLTAADPSPARRRYCKRRSAPWMADGLSAWSDLKDQVGLPGGVLSNSERQGLGASAEDGVGGSAIPTR
jgi:hypothetical protein